MILKNTTGSILVVLCLKAMNNHINLKFFSYTQISFHENNQLGHYRMW